MLLGNVRVRKSEIMVGVCMMIPACSKEHASVETERRALLYATLCPNTHRMLYCASDKQSAISGGGEHGMTWWLSGITLCWKHEL